MSWFRFCAVVIAIWGIAFFFLPNLANEIFGVDYVKNEAAEDWTQLVGLAMFAIAFLLHTAHRSSDEALRQAVARGALIFILPAALLLTYWQLLPDGPWNRLDLPNAVILWVMSYGLFLQSGLRPRRSS